MVAGDGSSGSEEENTDDDSDSRETAAYQCQHCFTTSKLPVFAL